MAAILTSIGIVRRRAPSRQGGRHRRERTPASSHGRQTASTGSLTIRPGQLLGSNRRGGADRHHRRRNRAAGPRYGSAVNRSLPPAAALWSSRWAATSRRVSRLCRNKVCACRCTRGRRPLFEVGAAIAPESCAEVGKRGWVALKQRHRHCSVRLSRQPQDRRRPPWICTSLRTAPLPVSAGTRRSGPARRKSSSSNSERGNPTAGRRLRRGFARMTHRRRRRWCRRRSSRAFASASTIRAPFSAFHVLLRRRSEFGRSLAAAWTLRPTTAQRSACAAARASEPLGRATRKPRCTWDPAATSTSDAAGATSGRPSSDSSVSSRIRMPSCCCRSESRSRRLVVRRSASEREPAERPARPNCSWIGLRAHGRDPSACAAHRLDDRNSRRTWL